LSYRNIFISSPAKLSTKNNQLCVQTEDLYTIPIEDINSIMLESRQITINTYTLGKLAENHVALFVCNEKHLPCACLAPLSCHSRQLKIIRLQTGQSKPFLKRLWQSIVKAKITNQSLCLSMTDSPNAQKLSDLIGRVGSGDPDNIEGLAAAVYFKSLFGPSFNRNIDNPINSALNYGYAILRGAIARMLAAYGFEPSVGICHHSELNPFNLADDLIEPFRPIVDLWVKTNALETFEFTSKTKQQLYNILSYSIISGGQRHSINNAIERLVISLSKSYEEKENKLILPELMGLVLHEYE